MTTESHRYYAVIFTAKFKLPSDPMYHETGEEMAKLAAEQPGYLGMDALSDAHGNDITVSYWKTLEDIKAWKNLQPHREAQQKGKEKWYEHYRIRICEVFDDYGSRER